MTQDEKAIWPTGGTFFFGCRDFFFCRFIVHWIPSFFARLYFAGRQTVKEREKKEREEQEGYIVWENFHFIICGGVIEDVKR